MGFEIKLRCMIEDRVRVGEEKKGNYQSKLEFLDVLLLRVGVRDVDEFNEIFREFEVYRVVILNIII